MKPRLAVLWANFGPYHYARLRALSREFDVTALQLFEREGWRGWENLEPPDGLRVRTLFPGRAEGERLRGVCRAVWRALNECGADAVLVPGYATEAAVAAAIWAQWHGVDAVLMSESTLPDKRRRGLTENLKAVLVKRLFHGAVVGGVRSASYVRALGIDSDRIAYCHNVVDNQFFSDGCGRVRTGDDSVQNSGELGVFLYVGRLAKEKNLEVLLRAFAAYKRAGGQWSCQLVGGGGLESDLRVLARDLGVSQEVEFAGMRAGDDLLRCYAQAGCLVLPSISEPWGLVVNEAMAAGLPVLVSDRCGCVDDLVMAGENGWVFDPWDEPGLTALFARVETLTGAEREAMGWRSREIISQYTPERFAEEVRRLICG